MYPQIYRTPPFGAPQKIHPKISRIIKGVSPSVNIWAISKFGVTGWGTSAGGKSSTLTNDHFFVLLFSRCHFTNVTI